MTDKPVVGRIEFDAAHGLRPDRIMGIVQGWVDDNFERNVPVKMMIDLENRLRLSDALQNGVKE